MMRCGSASAMLSCSYIYIGDEQNDDSSLSSSSHLRRRCPPNRCLIQTDNRLCKPSIQDGIAVVAVEDTSTSWFGFGKTSDSGGVQSEWRYATNRPIRLLCEC